MNYHKVEIIRNDKEEDIVQIKESKMVHVIRQASGMGFYINGASGELTVRTVGTFRDKAFYLSNNYNWVITRDAEGVLCLVPYKKD